MRFEVDGGVLAAAIDFDIELQTVAFVERNHPGAFDRADVDESVGLAVIALNEAEAFHRVEELNGAGRRFAGQLTLRTSAAPKAAAITTPIAAAEATPITTPITTVEIAARFTRSAVFHGQRFAFDFKVSGRNLAPAIHQREGQRLTFGEAGKARLFDRADVHEHIFAAFIALDEAEAFLTIEEFYDAIAFADDLGWHAGARSTATAAAKATTAAATATITAATIATAEAATVSAAATEAAATTAATAGIKATAVTAAEASTIRLEGFKPFFAETIALVAPTPTTTATTTAVISVETHALNVTFASSLEPIYKGSNPPDEQDAKPPPYARKNMAANHHSLKRCHAK